MSIDEKSFYYFLLSYKSFLHRKTQKSASCFRGLIGTCKPRHKSKTERAISKRNVQWAHTT